MITPTKRLHYVSIDDDDDDDDVLSLSKERMKDDESKSGDRSN